VIPAQRVFLIGLMGSGKSTAGRALASRLGWAYVDNDEAIAAATGRTVVELAADGTLHRHESEYVHRVADMQPRCVVGIPASTADNAADLDLLSASGILVYLCADVATLVNRVRNDAPRPWLDADPESTLKAMFTRRDPILRGRAAFVADAGEPVEDVVRHILDRLERD
jgi:shikimate kinase